MRITDLEKCAGNFRLSVEDMMIETGKIHGIIGRNGSGKTILLKLIMGIMKPDAGKIDYEGIALSEITLMSQRPYLLHDTVYENLIYPLRVRNIQPDDAEIDELLKRVNLYEQKDQYARSLSSGERQKLSFLRAVIFRPKFVMMDETLSNIDTDSEREILALIREIQAKDPITWLIVSHQLDFGNELWDVVHQMEKGRYCGIIKG